ncbi:hypothetical protein [Myroides sp. DW712]|uniref:hypothetical protein n=1 Tax=Myroides sp. DW712 TaxID=3389800 RepID=UPI00397DBBC4
MNFDEIKKSWDNQSVQSPNITEETLSASISRLPLDRIRKNALTDIILQTVAVIGIAFFPQLYTMPEENWFFFYGVYVLFAVVSFYYIIKMTLFYRLSNTLEMNSRDSLYEVYFHTRMYVQLYENFCFSIAPFVVFFIPFFVGFPLDKISVLFTQWIFVLYLIVLCAVVFFTCKYWIKRLYGRYLKQMKQNLDQFKSLE